MTAQDIQDLITTILAAENLDMLAERINDLADAVDGLGLSAADKAEFYDLNIDPKIEWTSLPVYDWTSEPKDTTGIYSWDGQRVMYLEGYRASLAPRQ